MRGFARLAGGVRRGVRGGRARARALGAGGARGRGGAGAAGAGRPAHVAGAGPAARHHPPALPELHLRRLHRDARASAPAHRRRAEPHTIVRHVAGRQRTGAGGAARQLTSRAREKTIRRQVLTYKFRI